MTRRNFFRALSALAALPFCNLPKLRFADETPKAIPLDQACIQLNCDSENLQRMIETIRDDIRKGQARVHRTTL